VPAAIGRRLRPFTAALIFSIFFFDFLATFSFSLYFSLCLRHWQTQQGGRKDQDPHTEREHALAVHRQAKWCPSFFLHRLTCESSGTHANPSLPPHQSLQNFWNLTGLPQGILNFPQGARFESTYRCYSVAMMGKEKLENGGKSTLTLPTPPSLCSSFRP
jgi:hypothetical protein